MMNDAGVFLNREWTCNGEVPEMEEISAMLSNQRSPLLRAVPASDRKQELVQRIYDMGIRFDYTADTDFHNLATAIPRVVDGDEIDLGLQYN